MIVSGTGDSMALFGCGAGSINVWLLAETAISLQSFDGFAMSVTGVALNRDVVAACPRDGNVRVWLWESALPQVLEENHSSEYSSGVVTSVFI